MAKLSLIPVIVAIANIFPFQIKSHWWPIFEIKKML
jgi:hypothetical protein